jgi:hypothetical protein
MSWVNRLTFELDYDFGEVRELRISPLVPGGSPGQQLDEALRVAREKHGVTGSPDTIYVRPWEQDPV